MPENALHGLRQFGWKRVVDPDKTILNKLSDLLLAQPCLYRNKTLEIRFYL